MLTQKVHVYHELADLHCYIPSAGEPPTKFSVTDWGTPK